MSKISPPFNRISLSVAILLPVIITALAFGFDLWDSHYYGFAHKLMYGAIQGIVPSALVTVVYLFRSFRKAGMISKGFRVPALLSFFIPFFIVAAIFLNNAYEKSQEIVFGGSQPQFQYVPELELATIYDAIVGCIVLNIWMLHRGYFPPKTIE